MIHTASVNNNCQEVYVTNSKTKRAGKYKVPMKRISVALESTEFDECKTEAKEIGLDMSAYLRMLIIQQRKQGARNGSKEKSR